MAKRAIPHAIAATVRAARTRAPASRARMRCCSVGHSQVLIRSITHLHRQHPPSVLGVHRGAPARQRPTVQCASLAPRRLLDTSKETMAYVIAEPCIDTKDNSCVEVCPVDCIHPTPDEPDYDQVPMLYIDPEECIDCDACVEACPVDACFAEDQLPEEWQNYIQTNADYYKKSAS